MLKPSALLSRLIPCCAAASSDPSTMTALLDRKNIGILSAACCDSTAGPKDEALKDSLRQAMERTGDGRAVVVSTITSAQQHMRALEAQADLGQKLLIQNVTTLFHAHGLSIFPLLIINGRVAFYGGVPPIGDIEQRLQRQPLKLLEPGS